MKINEKTSRLALGAILALGGLPAFAVQRDGDVLPENIKNSIEEARSGQENGITDAIRKKFPEEKLDFETIQYRKETETVDLSNFDGIAITIPICELQDHSPNGER